MRSRLLLLPYISVLLFACNSVKKTTGTITHNKPVYTAYKIDSNVRTNANVAAFLKPYSKEVKRQMNVVIGETETALTRKIPESTLGNFATDAMLNRAISSYNQPVDAAFVNIDGLRVDELQKGAITLGNIYELMPFDNVLVLLHLNGKQMMQLADFIASKKGWPVSGIKMAIGAGKAVGATINGNLIDAAATYTIATTDYTANGNEGAGFLKNIKQDNSGYLLRDAFIDYVKEQTRQGKKINASIENRITNAE